MNKIKFKIPLEEMKKRGIGMKRHDSVSKALDKVEGMAKENHKKFEDFKRFVDTEDKTMNWNRPKSTKSAEKRRWDGEGMPL